MGEGQPVLLLTDDDYFLRHLLPSGVKNGVVTHKAFKPRADERELSYTLRRNGLVDDAGLDVYQSTNVLKSGDTIGLTQLLHADITKVAPPLRPRSTPHNENAWGYLHCSTDLPNKNQMHDLAKCANQGGGVLRPIIFAPQDKGRDRPISTDEPYVPPVV